MELKEAAQSVVTIRTIPEGYNSGNKYCIALMRTEVGGSDGLKDLFAATDTDGSGYIDWEVSAEYVE